MQKSHISILFLFLVLFQFSFSQTFNGGLMVGLNASQIDGDDLGGYNKAGLAVGPYVYTKFSEKISGQVGIRYSGKGSATHKDNPSIFKIRLRYLEMPVTFGYHIMNFRLEAGGSIGYLLNPSFYSAGWYDFDDPPSPIDIEYCFGVNYQLFEHLAVNARFSYSLFYIQDDDRVQTGSFNQYIGPWYNNVLTFAVYYNFLGNSFR